MATNLLSPLDLLNLCKQERRRDIFTGISTIAIEITLLISLSHTFHLFLKRLGQPSVVSQMLAGILVGKTFLGHATDIPLAARYFKVSNEDHLTSLATMSRMIFMFLVGLELDPPYLVRNFRRAITISYSGAAVCAALALATTPLVYSLTSATGSESLFALALALVLSSTASPIVIRVATELKLTMTESGRLLIASALINDISFLLFIAVISIFTPNGVSETDSSPGTKLFNGMVALIIIGGSIALVRPAVKWLNRRNKEKGGIRGIELLGVLLFVLMVSCVTELMGYNSTMASFILGLVFPRTGATVRTVMASLSYFVHNFVVPVYFGYAGVQTDLTLMREKGVAVTVVALIVLGTVGKVGGTMIGGRLLEMTVREGLVSGLLLNLKGHVDLILISIARKYGVWGQATYMVLLITVLLNNMIVGPAAAFLINRDRNSQKYRSMGLEWLSLDSELRVLACLHSPHDAPTLLNLLEISAGAASGLRLPSSRSPLAAYLLHLVELTPRLTSHMLYHQRIDQQGRGDDHARQIDFAVDAFTDQTAIPVRQITVISSYDTMDQDVCRAAQELRASLIVLPFHRRLRFDGRLGAGRGGIRSLNRRTLRRAPCTVGVLVDRGMSGRFAEAAAGGALHSVAVVFVGGADDREAVAYGGRLAMHPCVSVVVFRLAGGEEEGDGEDEDFLRDFERRFVATGMVAYVERAVRDVMETVEVLMGMEGRYSLYVVGKGRRWGRGKRITEGMGEWEGEDELGEIGDLLASSEFMASGSVLVMKQHQLVAGKREEGGEGEELAEGRP